MSNRPRINDVLDAVPAGLFIGGRWRPATEDAVFAVDDPSTGRPLTLAADASAQDALAALDAACQAQSEWCETPPRVRAELLRAAYERLVERTEDLALLMTLEMGKPLAESRGEVAYAAEYFRWYSEEAVRVHGSYAIAPSGSTRLMTMRQPVGPCLMITPWNFPLAMGTRKIGPALAAGCTMVVKPAKQTPLTMLVLAEILEEVGVPAGVVNVVTTSQSAQVVEPLLDDPRLRKLTFTGSTEVGRHLAARAGKNLLRVSLELGGNAPVIVFADADLDQAVDGAADAKMRNIGEACTAANRVLVHHSIAAEFTARLARKLSSMVIGKGTRPGVEVGPLIDEQARTKVHALVEDALARGATLVTGGEVPTGQGWFYPPTVLAGVPATAKAAKQEIFGPVAPVMTFRTESQAIKAANSTEYGLVAYLFTRDIDRAMRVSEALAFGMIGLNQGVVSNPAAPFGGIKASGYGREGGSEGIDEYLQVKYVGMPR